MGIGLLFLPVITWRMTQSRLAGILAVALGIVIGINFLPTARAAMAKAESNQDFIFDHWQRGRGGS